MADQAGMTECRPLHYEGSLFYGCFQRATQVSIDRVHRSLHAMGINSILDKGNSKLQTVTIGCDLMPSPHDYTIEFTFDAEGNFALVGINREELK